MSKIRKERVRDKDDKLTTLTAIHSKQRRTMGNHFKLQRIPPLMLSHSEPSMYSNVP